MNLEFRKANENDISEIYSILSANLSEVSLFQQSEKEIRKNINDFYVAVDGKRAIAGCLAVHEYKGNISEIYSVAVPPKKANTGIGKMLMENGISIAVSNKTNYLWLATMKTEYFAKFGFIEMSKWELPKVVLLHKLKLIFNQPINRWIPALFGRHTFMKLTKQNCE